MTDLLTPSEVAELLSVSRDFVLALCRGGALRLLRRYWWVIPLALLTREVVGAVLMATVVPWLWAVVASLEAAH